MITEIEIEGFKSLEKVHLKLGGLNLFVGTNASGKSNFLEGLRVLQGIAYRFTIDEIFNGKPKGSTSEVWRQIRGGSSRAKFLGQRSQDKRTQELFFRVRLNEPAEISYSIEIAPNSGVVKFEELSIGRGRVFLRNGEAIHVGEDEDGLASSDIGLRDEEAMLSCDKFFWGDSELIEESCGVLLRTLRNVQNVAPSPDILRGYGQSFLSQRMGEAGENFPSLVKTIMKDSETGSAYLSWLRQLSPIELDDVTVLEGALGEPLFALKERGNTVPASVLSDGTLRFAAIVAAFFQPDMPDIITIEEIENGIHPSRLRLLLELLKSQSGGPGRSGPQVFATTHSPFVLSWLDESDFATTFVCKRDEETGASIIKPLSEVPRLVELARKRPIGDLFAEGWLEGVL